tara:strand:+ start:1023 stop:1595 length:573 start_codon:yes stop_codon:yes gene_type:complete
MAHQVKNYIYFKGGSWGDIVTRIVNNGGYPNHADEILLKDRWHQFDLKKLNSIGLETLGGHNLSALDLHLNNFQITIKDPSIQKIAADRFQVVNNLNIDQIFKVVKQYYPKKLENTIRQMDMKNQLELLGKKYKFDRQINATPIDLSNIFDRESLLTLLQSHFTFDHTVAKQLYDDWYSKQVQFGFVPNN